MKNKFHFIIGSQSPRRKQMGPWMGIPLKFHSVDLDEHSTEVEAEKIVVDIAAQKGKAVLSELKQVKGLNPLVLAADTMVFLGEKRFGKPKDTKDAKNILQQLSGQTHRVLTGFWLGDGVTGPLTRSVESLVTFEEIDQEILEYYLETGESLDKAGAYGIQGEGLSFISHVQGSYSNIVGLPLTSVRAAIKEFVGYREGGDLMLRDYFYGDFPPFS